MTRAASVHYLRHNKGESTPPRIMVLDTESRLVETQPREVQGLRCWVLRDIERAEGDPRPVTCGQAEGFTVEDMVAAVQKPLRSGKPWRLYTHNLSYDLGLTRLPVHLLHQGWELGRHNLASDSPWAYMKRGGHSLWLCDSFGWFPVKLERLGEILQLQKPPLPADDDSDQAWLHRCRADVEILTTALLRAMAEWDNRRLGVWSITGPASGWNTLLHFPIRDTYPRDKAQTVQAKMAPKTPKGERVLVSPDPAARAFERTALYSGRRDVWKIGTLTKGPYAEVDLKTAHLAICANYPLPYRRWARFDSLGLDDWRLAHRAAGLIAHCLVESPGPRYPLRLSGAVLHPRGRFWTVLAGPEIAEAKARGELVEIGPGYGYHLGEVMRPWAQWCLAILNDQEQEVDPIMGPMVKGWSRTVPGRWAMLHAREIKSGPSWVKDWALEPITVGSPPRRGYIFHLNRTWHESVTDQEADDSFPAVLAYIQSYCRLALNRLLDAIPTSALVSCNTEGAWVTEQALGLVDCPEYGHGLSLTRVPNDRTTALQALSRRTAPLSVQLKRTARVLEVLSPQHHKADGERLYAGVPRSAVELPDGRFQFQTWPKLRGQIQKGDPRGYVREERTVSLAGLPVSRWTYGDGHCEPVEVRYAPETGNVLQPPRPELERLHGPLRPLQHPALRRALA